MVSEWLAVTAMSLNACGGVLFVPRVPSPFCSKCTKSTLIQVRKEHSGLVTLNGKGKGVP